MPTMSISPGKLLNMVQNVVYALPCSRTFVKSSAAVEVSDLVGGTFAALAGANTTGIETSSLFVRCTGGAATIVCKKA